MRLPGGGLLMWLPGGGQLTLFCRCRAWSYLAASGRRSAHVASGWQPAQALLPVPGMVISRGFRAAASSCGFRAAVSSCGFRAAVCSRGFRLAASSCGFRAAVCSCGFRAAVCSCGFRLAASSRSFPGAVIFDAGSYLLGWR